MTIGGESKRKKEKTTRREDIYTRNSRVEEGESASKKVAEHTDTATNQKNDRTFVEVT